MTTSSTNEVTLDLGYTCQVNVRVVPVTTVSLETVTHHISALETEIAIKGAATGFGTDKVEAVFAWIIDRGDGDVDEHTLAGTMQIAGDGKYELKVKGKPPVLSVFEQRLFGKGRVGYRLSPKYPHAPTALVHPPDSKITFDNALRLKPSLVNVSGVEVGTSMTFALELGALCKKLLDSGYQAALFWEEDDSDKGEAAARNDFSASIVWDVYTKDQKRPWLVGCAPGSTIRSPKFSYPEAWEAGDAFEYSYSLAMQRPAARGPIQRFVTKGERLFSMAWPALTSFELECRLLPIPFAGVSVPRISAKGLVTGLHKDLSVSMKITLWKATSRWSFQPVGEARVASVEDGFFSAVLYEFPEVKDVCVADPLIHWLAGVSAKNTPEKDAVFFATARFHEAHLENQKLPLGCSLRYDAQVFRPFREATGVLAQASSATACCSREAFMGYTPVGEALRCLGLNHTAT